MAVNLSVLQFHDKHFVATVKKILAETELDPGLLELEITEGLFLEKREATSISFTELHAMGVRIAVDDFGTGYSSMSYLKFLPIDILKIDRSFVRDVTSIPGDTAIVRAIIAMAHSLQLTITAEGVETEAQCTFFRDQGCHEIQGYWYARPMPEDELRDWMRARNG
jgi:EAL domain-containing protein (putative c-di-GMP-specific phosphodiesterase class I)